MYRVFPKVVPRPIRVTSLLYFLVSHREWNHSAVDQATGYRVESSTIGKAISIINCKHFSSQSKGNCTAYISDVSPGYLSCQQCDASPLYFCTGSRPNNSTLRVRSALKFVAPGFLINYIQLPTSLSSAVTPFVWWVFVLLRK